MTCRRFVAEDVCGSSLSTKTQAEGALSVNFFRTTVGASMSFQRQMTTPFHRCFCIRCDGINKGRSQSGVHRRGIVSRSHFFVVRHGFCFAEDGSNTPR